MEQDRWMDRGSDARELRLPYEKPTLQRVELAIDETLSSGCKLGTDSACIGPPITAYDGGS